MHHHWQHDLGAHSEWQGDSGWRWWPLGQATTNSPGRIVLRGLNCPVCRAGWWHLAYNWQFLLSLPFWRHNKESHTEIRLLHTHVKWPKNRYKKKKKKISIAQCDHESIGEVGDLITVGELRFLVFKVHPIAYTLTTRYTGVMLKKEQRPQNLVFTLNK